MLITDRQREKVYEFLPATANALFAKDDIWKIIDELDTLVFTLLDAYDEPTNESRKVERFMDDLIWQNLHPEDFPMENGKP